MGKKPLGSKAYGSIPHLPDSRMGPSDHHCHEGQATICCEKPRDRHDRIIVTEKLDGSCMAVARLGRNIVALGRAGYLAETSPYPHLREFAEFVRTHEGRFLRCLSDGQRFVGEWMNVATGTKYQLSHEPFVVFDLMEGVNRLPYDEMVSAADVGEFVTPFTVSDGPAISIADAVVRLGWNGQHGAIERVEGCVWRVERKGQFDFIAKYVWPGKKDGAYLPGIGDNQNYLANEIVQ